MIEIYLSYKFLSGEQIGEHTAELNLGAEDLAAAKTYAADCLKRERALRTVIIYPSRIGGRSVRITAAVRCA